MNSLICQFLEIECRKCKRLVILNIILASELGLAESSSFRSDQFLFIIGGYNNGRLATTEILKPDGTVAWGPALPNAVSSHCSVTANDGRVFIMGGYPYKKKVWIYDPNTESFTPGQEMINDYRAHACAVFRSVLHNQREVLLVAGGWEQDTTEIWDYQTPGSSWTSSKRGILCFYMAHF